jgi:hypothetical protein
MTENGETERLPVRVTRTAFTAGELAQLRVFLWELPSAAEAAAELLGTSGPAPTGMRLERLLESTERVADLLVEIETILSSRLHIS